MKRLLHSCIFLTLISIGFSSTAQLVLTPSEFESAITNKDSIQILDVRTPGEYRSGHIANSLQADWNNASEFDKRIAYIDKTKPVYVYCLAGVRSAAAAQKMRLQGFTNVYELKGGINAWKADNKTLKGSVTVKQMPVDSFNIIVKSSSIVLVDFGADWCPPCKKMNPVIKNLTDHNPGKFTLVKVDGGKDLEVMKQHGVTTLPVFIIFKNGKQIWRHDDGLVTEAEFNEVLKTL